MRTLKDIRQQLPVNAEDGLGPDAAARSRQQFGSNRLTPLPREPLWKKFLEKFDEPIIKILLAAALLSMVVDLFHPRAGAAPGAHRYLLGGVATALVLVVIAGAYLLRRQQWLPSILFLSAVVLGLVGLSTGHSSWDGLAVMVAVILATGVA